MRFFAALLFCCADCRPDVVIVKWEEPAHVEYAEDCGWCYQMPRYWLLLADRRVEWLGDGEEVEWRWVKVPHETWAGIDEGDWFYP